MRSYSISVTRYTDNRRRLVFELPPVAAWLPVLISSPPIRGLASSPRMPINTALPRSSERAKTSPRPLQSPGDVINRSGSPLGITSPASVGRAGAVTMAPIQRHGCPGGETECEWDDLIMAAFKAVVNPGEAS